MVASKDLKHGLCSNTTKKVRVQMIWVACRSCPCLLKPVFWSPFIPLATIQRATLWSYNGTAHPGEQAPVLLRKQITPTPTLHCSLLPRARVRHMVRKRPRIRRCARSRSSLLLCLSSPVSPGLVLQPVTRPDAERSLLRPNDERECPRDVRSDELAAAGLLTRLRLQLRASKSLSGIGAPAFWLGTSRSATARMRRVIL